MIRELGEDREELFGVGGCWWPSPSHSASTAVIVSLAGLERAQSNCDPGFDRGIQSTKGS
ncbi:hypothetical protein M413DRAFT_443971 [Hebeloma cylindrosporum]|uniref:Uncharacterized protein n=1 Tax=Hebeloma cylindrosporum TaxID=76867 RepID=A0A0C3CHU6_HEBCY|nr:hypothetical protein M413DRAFT_443971 [Hebeloma cylindrosporum h7]